MPRIITTPPVADAEFSAGGGRSYWKRVLPVSKINYRGKDGKRRVIDFNDQYLRDVQAAYADNALDQTPFVLADEDNRHTMDPERFRGDVTAMAREHELPEDVKQALTAKHGRVPEGLYAKVTFATKKAAKAVRINPKLPVSMRIREDHERSDGKKYHAMAIHVLGTLDPKIPALGEWTPATDLSSEYASDELLDLSNETYSEARMPKNGKRKDTKLSNTATVEVPKIEDIDLENIDETIKGWSDEQLAAFLAANDTSPSSQRPDPDKEPDDDDDEPDDDDDEPDDDGEPQMSNSANADLTFANEQAATARREARDALNRAAEIRWSGQRESLLSKGVPPWVLDLAEPVLARANDTVVDLSNYGEDDINLTEMVAELVEGYKGTIDFSAPSGHGGDGDDDPDKAILDKFTAMTADL
jgi:hypothetical protein